MPQRIGIIVLSCAAGLLAQERSRSTPARTAWKPLEFLIGTWEARTHFDNEGHTIQYNVSTPTGAGRNGA